MLSSRARWREWNAERVIRGREYAEQLCVDSESVQVHGMAQGWGVWVAKGTPNVMGGKTLED